MYALRLVPTVGLAVVALLISACHLGGLTAAQPALFVLSAECAGTFRDRLAAWQETADCAPAGARSQGPLWPGARPRITPSTEDTDCSPPETLVPETCELTEPMDGQAFYVAYVLPVDVPDPEVPVVIGLEATCERTTRELKVVDGAVIRHVRWELDAHNVFTHDKVTHIRRLLHQVQHEQGSLLRAEASKVADGEPGTFIFGGEGVGVHSKPYGAADLVPWYVV